MRTSLHRQRGIGLIETVVTLLIIAGTAIALLRFQNYLAYSSNVAQEQNDAIQLAVNKIEVLRDFTTLTGSGNGAYPSIVSGTSSVTGVNTTYALTWTVTTFTNPNYKTLDVAVSWTDRYGVAHSIEETSQIAGIDPSFSLVVM